MSEWVEEMRIRDLASRIRPEPDCVTWSNAVLLDALGEIDRLRDTLREQMEYTVELMTALRHAMSEPSVHDHGNCELCDAQEREITALRAQLAAVERERDTLAEFWSVSCELLLDADSGAPDAEVLLDAATDAGLVAKEPFDPAKHGEDFCEWADEGDPIRVPSKLGTRLDRHGAKIIQARAALRPPAEETP